MNKGEMMKYLLTFLCVLMFCNPVLAQIHQKEFDGSDWERWPPTTRGNYVTGFIDGVAYTARNSSRNVSKDYDDGKAQILVNKMISKPEKKGKKEIPKTYNHDELVTWGGFINASVNDRLRHLFIGDITNDTIQQGLDVFYSDYKNKRIPISDAIYVVKQQIEGTPQDDIERILLYLRQGKNDRKVLTITDEKGTYIRSIVFP